MCAAVAAVGVGEVIAGEATAASWGALILLVGFGTFSGVGAKRLLSAPTPKALPAVDPESTVLAIAAAGGGRVTVIEVAAKSSLTIDEAESALTSLGARGLASSIVTEDGVVLYEIKGLLGPAEKRAAVDILDT